MSLCKIRAWPREGEPRRLYLHAAPLAGVRVFVEHREWPRDNQRGLWQISVAGIDPRFGQAKVLELEAEVKRLAIGALFEWLSVECSVQDPRSVSWNELCQYAQAAQPRKRRRYRRRA
jgi:hypothetical protein